MMLQHHLIQIDDLLWSDYKGPALVPSGSSSPAVRTETIIKILRQLLGLKIGMWKFVFQWRVAG